MSDNPYEASQNPELTPAPKPTFLLWGVGTVFGSATLGGIIGCAVGMMMGKLVPGYYRSIFNGGDQPGFDPVAVGIGQGLSQGIAFGGFVGLVVVALFCWYRSRVASGIK